MYLSELYVKNYRSIKELHLSFEKGKNVIVGKNNSGKSNIIRAIDLVLGESLPTYHKSENITENDFFNGDTSNPIYIFCQLQRLPNEELNYDEIYNCYGYKIHISEITEWGQNRRPAKWNPVRYDLTGSEYFWINLEKAFAVNGDDNQIKTCYIDPKLKNQRTFENELNDKFQFAYAFRATKDYIGRIVKELRFFYRENANQGWIMAFSASIRNELLQSAIIQSFRDPQNILKLNQWSWFGKLLKNYVQTDNEELLNTFKELKRISNGLFEALKNEINNSKVKLAFPETEVSFQFNPDNKIDIYKSALIYVDDGFNSQLTEKGAGIQSAVIIGLFDFYCRHIAHRSCSLLAIEEPELYLHPQARRVISNRLDDFLEGGRNQVIISTHASEFIATPHEELNVIVTQKRRETGTIASNIAFNSSKEKQILVKSQNAEMFFADKVILVEGGDKYILEAVAKKFGKFNHPDLGTNWIDERNISIIAVGGKTEFVKYYNKLKEVGIPCYILADFDFFLRRLAEFLTITNQDQGIRNELNALKGQIGVIDVKITEETEHLIEVFCNEINQKRIGLEPRNVRKIIKDEIRVKYLEDLPNTHHTQIISFFDKLKTIGIYILKGELECYYTKTCKEQLAGLQGKEEKAIYIVSELITESQSITDLVDCTQYDAFLDLVLKG